MNTSITTRSVTARLLLPLLATAFLALTTLPARAAPPGNSGYLAMQVTDLPAAVHFFRNMLNCAPVDAGADTSQTALLDCGNGNIVSLTLGATAAPHALAGTLVIDDARATAMWLRTRHVRIVGGPSIVAEGPGLDRVSVTLVTPWGQPLRLVSHATGRHADAAFPGAQLAAQ